MGSPSVWSKTPVKAYRLSNMPVKTPHTQKEIMKATASLHKMADAQSKTYGGEKSKLLKVGITETSLLQSIAGFVEEVTKGDDA